jgi:uncharacterized damage-inducible protein DinB
LNNGVLRFEVRNTKYEPSPFALRPSYFVLDFMHLPSSITTRTQYQHKSLLELIDGLTDEQIRRNIIPGKWSIFENIVHLAVYQHIFCDRITRMLEEVNPEFARYSAESDPNFLDACHKSSREIMQDLLTTRKELCIKILGIPESELSRSGIHPLYGKMNLLQWLNFFLLHEAHHLFTVFKLSAELKTVKM